MMPVPPESAYFLYADDDFDDQEFFRAMINDIDPGVGVVTVNNGLELLQYLNNIPDGGNFPCCIILDINMPVWDGIRALKALKVEQRLKDIPVIIFTTSLSLRDNELCLMLGAKAFISKPVRQQEFTTLSSRFANFCSDKPARQKDRPETAASNGYDGQ